MSNSECGSVFCFFFFMDVDGFGQESVFVCEDVSLSVCGFFLIIIVVGNRKYRERTMNAEKLRNLRISGKQFWATGIGRRCSFSKCAHTHTRTHAIDRYCLDRCFQDFLFFRPVILQLLLLPFSQTSTRGHSYPHSQRERHVCMKVDPILLLFFRHRRNQNLCVMNFPMW